jgi:hypothetical protein
MQIADVRDGSQIQKRLPGMPGERLSRWTKARYVAINLFLISHIVAVAVWCIPLDSPVLPICRSLLRPYFLWSGLFQSWDMFCPIPKSSNSYIEAVVIYADGTEKTWTFPRMEQLTLTQRYIKERYRKFGENLSLEQNELLWADVARYVARVNNIPSNPVKTVALIEEISPIAVRQDGSYAPQPWQQHMWYGYGVRGEDLK